MRIVYSIESIAHSGGIERVLCSKANYFANVLQYDVHIIVLDSQNSAPFFPFSPKIRIHSLEIKEIKHKPYMIFGSRSKKLYRQRLFQKLQEIQPDVTISFFGLDSEFLYKSKDRSKKILEFHFTKNYLIHLGKVLRGAKLYWLRMIWLRLLTLKEAYYAGKYKHIVLLTEKDKTLWGGKSKFEVIPNPLSFISKFSAPLDRKRIITMGRYVLPKGFDLLILAFKQLSDDFPDWELNLYGEGHEKFMLQQQINELSLQNKILLKEPVKNVEQAMLEASLFVLPSQYEGFGLVLTEAMACGVPCVSFDCECGPSEIIKHNEDGFLVPTGDVAELAQKMKLLIQDQELRKTMGKMAQQNVQRFEINQIIKRWDCYLDRVMKS